MQSEAEKRGDAVLLFRGQDKVWRTIKPSITRDLGSRPANQLPEILNKVGIPADLLSRLLWRRQNEAFDGEQSLVYLAEGDLHISQAGVEAFHAGIHIGAEVTQFAAHVVDASVHASDQGDHQGGETHTGRQDGRDDSDSGPDDPLHIAAHPRSIARNGAPEEPVYRTHRPGGTSDGLNVLPAPPTRQDPPHRPTLRGGLRPDEGTRRRRRNRRWPPPVPRAATGGAASPRRSHRAPRAAASPRRAPSPARAPQLLAELHEATALPCVAVEVQNQVGRRLRADLARLHNVLDSAASQGVGTLGRVADRVCDAFNLSDARGRRQRASCRKALGELEAKGHISLPLPQRRSAGVRRPRVLSHPVASAHDVPDEVGKLRDLVLVRVETDAQRRVWNTLMEHEHPRGGGPFVGHQLRYLVGSAHGWLGGIGFAASARRLKARDTWVGWDDAGRRAHLHRVVGLCRFLIRPDVVCRNLASHVLGWAARTVGEDFERLCGYRPWLLETFVDETEHTGASLRAANWVRVGETCGRGRQDRTHATPETRKAVYLYALEPAWRERLAVPGSDAAALAPGEGLDAQGWAGFEFGGAPLGDARLSARLVQSAQQMAQSPMRAITGATQGTRALVKGHYRLIDQPADSAVTVENILAPHRERTLQRMGSEQTVLCIQDGTRVNFTRRGQTQGLGGVHDKKMRICRYGVLGGG